MAEVGQEIPELQVIPTAAQIFMFSAVTWNRHHIHYNKDAALAEGHPDIVVQRALLGNFMARQLGDWLGAHGHVQRLTWKVQKSATPGNVLRCQGRVVAEQELDGRRQLHCALTIIDHGDAVVASGEATVIC